MAILLGAGFLMATTAAVSLLSPGGVLERMWRLNPRARADFARMGPWAAALLAAVAIACALASIGLWRGDRRGHRLAVVGLVVNLIGDAANGTFGGDPRALVGLPIAGAILAYLLSRRVRAYFAPTTTVGD